MTNWDLLFDLASGGSSVAVKPNEVQQKGLAFVHGESPAGVEAALVWFNTPSESDSSNKLLFLVGGPGGGKSHTASRLVSSWQEIAPKDAELAHRKHTYKSVSGKEVVLVNDATIKSGTSEKLALISDLDEILTKRQDAIICVNRGILVEEISSARDEHPELVELCRWVQSTTHNADNDGHAIEVSLQTDVVTTGKVSFNNVGVSELFVLNFDVCSLFERRPRIEFEGSAGERLVADKYQVAQLSQRMTDVSFETPATKLFESIANNLDVLPAETDMFLDPRTANLLCLREPSIRASLGTLCRSAEITASRRFTYREVWGIVARLVAGDAPEIGTSSQFGAWLVANQPVATDPVDYFIEFTELARFRFSEALFAAPGIHGDGSAGLQLNVVTRMMSAVDPIKDMEPGVFLGTPEAGWANPVSDSFTGAFSANSPLESLLGQIGETDSFRSIVQDFDKSLDKSFVAAMESTTIKHQQRVKLVTWYSAYLARLYACANGISAFMNAVSMWTQIWQMSPSFPSEDIEGRFMALLRPERRGRQGVSSSLIPIFESKTKPILGEMVEPTLALKVNSVGIETARNGESLFLVLVEKNSVIAKVLLDFSLLREAMACIPGHVGVTELSTHTAPRLERIRSANLVPSRHAARPQYRMVKGEQEDPIAIEGLSK